MTLKNLNNVSENEQLLLLNECLNEIYQLKKNKLLKNRQSYDLLQEFNIILNSTFKEKSKDLKIKILIDFMLNKQHHDIEFLLLNSLLRHLFKKDDFYSRFKIIKNIYENLKPTLEELNEKTIYKNKDQYYFALHFKNLIEHFTELNNDEIKQKNFINDLKGFALLNAIEKFYVNEINFLSKNKFIEKSFQDDENIKNFLNRKQKIKNQN